MCANEKAQILREILAHLHDNPDAEDTLEGIGEWWLLEQQVKRWSAGVKEAVAELVADGWILERKGADARSRYQVNPQRSQEIKTLLKQNNSDCDASNR